MNVLCKYCESNIIMLPFIDGIWKLPLMDSEGNYWTCLARSRDRDAPLRHEPMDNLEYLEYKLKEKEHVF